MLSSPYSFSEPMSTAAGFSPEIIFVSAKRIFRYSPETYGASPLRWATGIVSSPQGVVRGFPGASISLGCPNKSIAPFSFPRYLSRSSNLSYVKPRTAPRIVPFVLGDHPAVAIVSVALTGARILPVAGPRVQLLAIVQGSRCTFESPNSLNRSSVQWLARSSCGEPVSRGPIRSVRYFMLDFSSAWSDFTCSSIFVSISTIGSGFGASAFAASAEGRYGRGRRGNISCSCAVLYAHAASTCAPSFRSSFHTLSNVSDWLWCVLLYSAPS